MRLPLLLSFPLLVLLGAAQLPSSVFASSLYSGWIYPGDTFTVQGRLYSLTQGTSPYQLLLTSGAERYFLSYDACVQSEDKQLRYCFRDSDFIACDLGRYACPSDNPECCPYDVAHIRYDAGKAVYGARLEVLNASGIVTVKRTPDRTSLKLGESATVKLEFTNNGEDSAMITYQETLPDGFLPTYSADFTKQGVVLSLRFSLGPNATRSFTYKVKADAYVTGLFTGSLAYTSKREEGGNVPSPFIIMVPSPFTITRSLAPASVGVDEETLFTYTLTNNDGQYAMDAIIRFDGLGPLLTTLPTGVTREETHHAWRVNLKRGESKSVAFRLRAKRTGSYAIVSNATMTLEKESFSHRLQETLTVTVTQATLDLRLPEKVQGGDAYSARLFFDNKAGDTDFFRVEGVLRTPDGDHPFSMGSVARNTIPLALDVNLTAPVSEQEQNVRIGVDASYETSRRERFNLSTTKTVRILPVIEPYVVTQRLNTTAVKAGDSVTMTVTVKNLQDRFGTVTVTDILPGAAIVTQGFRQQEMSLQKGESREAYAYVVTIPESFEGGLFTFTTQLFERQSGVRVTKSINITVENPDAPSEPDEEEDIPAVEPAAPLPPSPEQKPGLLRRIVDSIGSFFSRILS